MSHALYDLLKLRPAVFLPDPEYVIRVEGKDPARTYAQIFKSGFVLYGDSAKTSRSREAAMNRLRQAIDSALLLGTPQVVTCGGEVRRYTAGLLYLCQELGPIPIDHWCLAVLRPLQVSITEHPLKGHGSGSFECELGLTIKTPLHKRMP